MPELKVYLLCFSIGNFFQWANPGLFFIYFRLFKNTIFTANKCEKSLSSIWCWDSNSQPLEHESPPRTTRPRLASYRSGWRWNITPKKYDHLNLKWEQFWLKIIFHFVLNAKPRSRWRWWWSTQHLMSSSWKHFNCLPLSLTVSSLL